MGKKSNINITKKKKSAKIFINYTVKESSTTITKGLWIDEILNYYPMKV